MSSEPIIPWYQHVAPGDATLRQGDILFGFDCLVPTPYILPKVAEEPALAVVSQDVLILTASCDLDLANPKKKIDFVLLCPHWDWKTSSESADSGIKPNDKGLIESGRMPRYCLLANSELQDCPMGLRVVDFNRLFQVPRNVVDEHVSALKAPRLRMNSPYREHLAQSFATCFARVALPLRATQAIPPAPSVAPGAPSSPAAR